MPPRGSRAEKLVRIIYYKNIIETRHAQKGKVWVLIEINFTPGKVENHCCHLRLGWKQCSLNYYLKIIYICNLVPFINMNNKGIKDKYTLKYKLWVKN